MSLFDDEHHRKAILNSLTEVGSTKSVGYLPLRTITKLLKIPVDEIRENLNSPTVRTMVFQEDQTCISGGALFAFDDRMMRSIIDRHHQVLQEQKWPPDSSDIIGKLAEEWYERDNPVMPFIRELFGDLTS